MASSDESSESSDKFDGSNFTDDINCKLKKEGFLRRAIAGDGNCFYRAVSYALSGTDTNFDELRIAAAESFLINRDRFRPLFNEELDFYRMYGRILQDREHADNMAIQALSIAKNVKINIRNSNMDITRILPQDSQDPSSIIRSDVNLLYTGDGENGHYDYLCPCAIKSKASIIEENSERPDTFSPYKNAHLISNVHEEQSHPSDVPTEQISKHNEDQYSQMKRKKRECPICHKLLSRSCHLNRHLLTHSEERSFECRICSKAFKQSDTLNAHMRTHSKGKDLECPICHKIFTRPDSFKRHKNSHSKSECPICKSEYRGSVRLKKHMKTHPKCRICKKQFLKSINLKAHILLHDKTKKFQCKQCPKSFMIYQYLTKHMLVHSTEDLNLKCTICSKRFKRNDSLRNHMKIVHSIHSNERNYICKLCERGFNRASYLKIHMFTHSTDYNLQCPICPLRFHRPENLRMHILSHSKNNLQECPVCQMQFNRPDYFKRHLQTHSENYKKFTCNVCGKKFGKVKTLNRHMDIHSDTIQFQCTTCKKQFRRKDYFLIHQQVHSDCKGFQCPICKMKFKGPCNLKRHEAIHFKTKQFQCSICKLLFSKECHLLNHMKVHATSLPTYKQSHCYFCKCFFDNHKDMERHMATHTREKPIHTSKFNSHQLEILRIFFVQDQHLTKKRTNEIISATNLTCTSIEEYFVYFQDRAIINENDRTSGENFNQDTLHNDIDNVNISSGPNIPRSTTVPQPVHRNRLFFYRRHGRIRVRNLRPDEETLDHLQLYYTPWELEAQSDTGRVAVGLTSSYDMVKSARGIYSKIVKGNKKDLGCSYRIWYKKGWTPRNEDSRPFGIYTKDRHIALKLKWYIRLRLLSLGTLHPHEPIQQLHHCAQELENIMTLCNNYFPPPTQRWIAFSADAIDAHSLDSQQQFPGINNRLISRFKNSETGRRRQ